MLDTWCALIMTCFCNVEKTPVREVSSETHGAHYDTVCRKGSRQCDNKQPTLR